MSEVKRLESLERDWGGLPAPPRDLHRRTGSTATWGSRWCSTPSSSSWWASPGPLSASIIWSTLTTPTQTAMIMSSFSFGWWDVSICSEEASFSSYSCVKTPSSIRFYKSTTGDSLIEIIKLYVLGFQAFHLRSETYISSAKTSGSL